MTVFQLANKFINREQITEFIDNDKLMRIARYLKADTSIAERLRGRGFIADALNEAIQKRVNEIEQE